MVLIIILGAMGKRVKGNSELTTKDLEDLIKSWLKSAAEKTTKQNKQINSSNAVDN